jgi:hypothetical protein
MLCEKNTFQPSEGKTACAQCGFQKYSGTGAIECYNQTLILSKL